MMTQLYSTKTIGGLLTKPTPTLYTETAKMKAATDCYAFSVQCSFFFQ